ncbi:hypothetical protein [Streptomyces sp. NPDC002467]|uniref:hypothetical protein n=1 Tax=Streptomyces sp. NPDC002467 TaxID=3364647 RepID=UPI0036CCEBBB
MAGSAPARPLPRRGRLGGRHDEIQLHHFLNHLGEGASAMPFRCTACGTHLAYADAS